MGDKPLFSPIPMRAMSDTRLTASHWRLLSAIAWHDRFGKNGVGCYTGHNKLAGEACIHYTNLGRLAADLEQWSYVKVSRHPLNRRLRIYSLNYNDNQATVGRYTNNDAEGTEHDASKTLEVGELTNNEGAIVGEQNRQVPERIEEGDSKYIPLSGSFNKSCETGASRHQDLGFEEENPEPEIPIAAIHQPTSGDKLARQVEALMTPRSWRQASHESQRQKARTRIWTDMTANLSEEQMTAAINVLTQADFEVAERQEEECPGTGLHHIVTCVHRAVDEGKIIVTGRPA